MRHIGDITQLNPDEKHGLKVKNIKTHGELNKLEILNIAKCELWLKDQQLDDILSIQFVKLLHKKMFEDVWDWAGIFRTSEKSIGQVHPSQIQEQLLALLREADYWFQNEIYSPLVFAARLHVRFEQIHPFPNGNGRHGRILTNLYLQHVFKHPPIKWLDLTRYKNSEELRKNYIASLRAADDYDFEPILEFVGAK